MENRLTDATDYALMWNVLGKDAMYVEIGTVWKEQIISIASERDDAERFKGLMDRTEVKHLFNGSTEVHNFMLEVPKEFTPEDIQAMADVILAVAKDTMDRPFVSLDGQYQKSQVIITNDEEPELLGVNKTEGYSSGKIFMPILESLTKPGRANDGMF